MSSPESFAEKRASLFPDRALTDELLQDPDSLLGAKRVGPLIPVLSELLATQPEETSIRLPNSTLGHTTLAELLEIFTLREDQLDARIRKFESHPEIGDSLCHALGGLLTHYGVPGGAKAKEDALALLVHLDRYRRKGPTEETTIEEEEEILTPELLDQAFRMTSIALSVEGSVPDQLDNPFSLASLGMVVDPKDTGIFGFTLPQLYLKVLGRLKYEESAPVLEEWTLIQLATNLEDCIGFLRVFTQFTAFLDQASFVRLYATSEGEIPLLPWRSYHRAIRSAIAHLRKYEQMDNYIRSLEEIEALITQRFYQITKGPLKESISASVADALAPSLDDLAMSFTEWATIQTQGGFLSPDEAAYKGVIMMEQSGVKDFKAFCDLVAELSPDLERAFRKQAVKFSLMTDEAGEFRVEIMNEALQALRIPWQDAAQIDFSEIICPETEVLEVYYAPGTYGPSCRGHYDFIKRIQEYINFMNAQDPPESHIQRIIFIAPITNVIGVPEYDKNPAQIGTVQERIASILIPMSELDRERKQIFISTKLQPEPVKAEKIDRSIAHTINAFIAKVQKDMKKAGRVTSFSVVPVVCVGIDEFQGADTEDGWRLNPQQPKKLKRPCLGIGRYPLLRQTIEAGHDFAKTTGARNIILTPGTPMTSSHEAVEGLWAGVLSRFPLSVIPYALRHYSLEAIAARRDRLRQETPKEQPKPKIPSVSTIYHRILSQYEKMVSEYS